MMKISGCPFCHHQNITQEKEHLRSTGAVETIFQCSECACFYPKNGRDARAIEDFYAAKPTNMKEFKPADMEEYVHKDSYVIRMLKKYVKPGGRALDIGSYIGGFVYNLERLGLDSYGIELQDRAVRFASEVNALKVFKGSFPDDVPDKIPSGGYSLISFMESVYYATDIKQAFERAHEMLLPGGLLLMQNTCGSSAIYQKNDSSFFRRFNDYVQAIPTYLSSKYWVIRSGFAIMEERELPVRAINRFYKYRGRRLKGALSLLGDFLNALDQKMFRRIELADKFIILARKV